MKGEGGEQAPYNKELPKSCPTWDFSRDICAIKKPDYKYLSLEHKFVFIYKHSFLLHNFIIHNFP